MGILSYIAAKKEEFNKAKEGRRLVAAERREAQLKELQAERKVQQEKAEIRKLKEERFRNSAPGRFVAGVGKVLKESKARGAKRQTGGGFAGFGTPQKRSASVSGPFGASPFTGGGNMPTVKRAKKSRGNITVIIKK